MATSNPFKKILKRNPPSGGVVVVVRGKNKEDNQPNIAVSDKGVQANPDILQEAWAAVQQLPPEAQGTENESSKTGRTVIYWRL